MTPEGFATRLHLFRKLPKFARIEVEHAIARREFIDLGWRLEIAQECEENGKETNTYKLPENYHIWVRKARKLNWDMHKLTCAFMNKFTENPSLYTQEDYERLGVPDYVREEDEDIE